MVEEVCEALSNINMAESQTITDTAPAVTATLAVNSEDVRVASHPFVTAVTLSNAHAIVVL